MLFAAKTGIFCVSFLIRMRKMKKMHVLFLRNRHLEMDWVIQKDQIVIIETQIGGVTVAGSGLALDNAQLGDLLKVLNQSSNVVVEGSVVSEKKVKIITK